MRTERCKCGCVVERGSGRERYVKLCTVHQAEADECHNSHMAFMAARRESESLSNSPGAASAAVPGEEVT